MANRFDTVLSRALEARKNIPASDLAGMLSCDDESFMRELFAAAGEVKARCGKTEVLPRGLIETSNSCAKNCLYCGIRRGNSKVSRYSMDEESVLDCIAEARRRGYPAVAFQAGELESEANTAFYERLLGHCRGLEVTLSLGEQTEAVYRRWKDAGALRYLIRIETSSRELYSRLHPAECSFDRRLGCIRTLKRLGYVTGTGVMIGFPTQQIADLASDIVFFGEENVDMVGMGPYIPHAETPLGADMSPRTPEEKERLLRLSLRMISLTRLYLHDVNIVSATALETLDPERGRDRGIEAGANVVMPNLTPGRFRCEYSLYPGKAQA